MGENKFKNVKNLQKSLKFGQKTKFSVENLHFFAENRYFNPKKATKRVHHDTNYRFFETRVLIGRKSNIKLKNWIIPQFLQFLIEILAFFRWKLIFNRIFWVFSPFFVLKMNFLPEIFGNLHFSLRFTHFLLKNWLFDWNSPIFPYF